MNLNRTRYFAAFCISICWASLAAAQQIEAFFSPHGGCAAAICREIDAAKSTIDIIAYELTNPEFAVPIAAANRRGVTVRIILDRAQERTPEAYGQKMERLGIGVMTDRTEKLQHNKYVIIDGSIVLTGSYNWSLNAENNNAENLLVIRDTATATAFAKDFATHWSHSTAFRWNPIQRKQKKSPRATGFSNPSRPH